LLRLFSSQRSRLRLNRLVTPPATAPRTIEQRGTVRAPLRPSFFPMSAWLSINPARRLWQTVLDMQIEEFVMSNGKRLALVVGLVAFSRAALAADDVHPMCVDVSAPKAVVAARHGSWTVLNDAQWEFLRGIYVMNPETPPGLPYGDHAVLARFDGNPGGIVFFIDDNKACTPMVAPAELVSVIDEVATRAVKHDGAGL
jgi:hypothetical protein